jgi:hypothetical protein
VETDLAGRRSLAKARGRAQARKTGKKTTVSYRGKGGRTETVTVAPPKPKAPTPSAPSWKKVGTSALGTPIYEATIEGEKRQVATENISEYTGKGYAAKEPTPTRQVAEQPFTTYAAAPTPTAPTAMPTGLTRYTAELYQTPGAAPYTVTYAQPVKATDVLTTKAPAGVLETYRGPLSAAEKKQKKLLEEGKPTLFKKWEAVLERQRRKAKGVKFVPTVLAVGVAKGGIDVLKGGVQIIRHPVKSVKGIGTTIKTLATEPQKIGYPLGKYISERPGEAIGRTIGIYAGYKGLTKVIGVAATKAKVKVREYKTIEVKPSKVTVKGRIVTTKKGPVLKGEATFKGKAEAYYKMPKWKRGPYGFPEEGYVSGYRKLFREKYPDIQMKVKIAGPPTDYLGKVKGQIFPGREFIVTKKAFGPAGWKLTRKTIADPSKVIRVKGKMPVGPIVRGKSALELYDIRAVTKGKPQFAKLTRRYEVGYKKTIAKKPIAGKRQIGDIRTETARIESAIKVRPTKKLEIVGLPKEKLFRYEFEKPGMYGYGGTRAAYQRITKTPLLRTKRLPQAEIIYPVKGQEVFFKGKQITQLEVLPKGAKLTETAKEFIGELTPKKVRVRGVLGVGLEAPITVIEPVTKVRTTGLAQLAQLQKAPADIIEGVIQMGRPLPSVAPAVALIPLVGLRGRVATRPTVRTATRLEQVSRQEYKPIARPLLRPASVQQVEAQRFLVEPIPIPRTTTRTRVGTRLERVQIPRTGLIQEPVFEPIVIVPPAPRAPRPFPEIPPPRRMKKKPKRKRVKPMRVTKYKPSLVAAEKAIYGKKPKRLTGLEVRPILYGGKF